MGCFHVLRHTKVIWLKRWWGWGNAPKRLMNVVHFSSSFLLETWMSNLEDLLSHFALLP